MRKIQFASGGLWIEGWDNYDRDMDISKPIPIESETVEAVFCEQSLDHITPQRGWNFLDECYRILCKGGVIRITVSDFVKLWKEKNPVWLKVNQEKTGNNGTLKDQLKSVIFGTEHHAVYCSELLKAIMESIGFQKVTIQKAFESDYEALRNVEQHWHAVGKEVTLAEAGCVEGIKL